ncbi:MAG: hypothetical protein HQK57_02910 [Deltaproteobacteria bacterium]|nr:hypothetical protein [Deltaproteobacteria bacterium]
MKIFRLGISLLAVTSLLCLSLSINSARCYAAESATPAAAPDSNKAVSPANVPIGTDVKTPAVVTPTKSAESPAKVEVNPPAKDTKPTTNNSPAEKPAAPVTPKGKENPPALGDSDNAGTTGPTRLNDTLKPKPLSVLPEPYVFPKEQTVKKVPSGGKLPAKDEKELLGRARKYWALRKEGDNKQAYDMEHPKFRAKFKLQGYLPSSGTGIEYRSIKVLSAEKKLNEPNRALVKVEIKSLIYGMGKPIPNQVIMADTWEKTQGKWYHILYIGLFADHDPTIDDANKGVAMPDPTKDTVAKPAPPMGAPPKMPMPAGVPGGDVSQPPVVATPPSAPLLLPQIKGIPGEGPQKGQAPASPMPGSDAPKSPGPGMQMSTPGAMPAGPGMQISPVKRPSVPGMEITPGAPSSSQTMPGSPSSGPTMPAPAKDAPAAAPMSAPAKQ